MSKLSDLEVAELLNGLADWELDPDSGAIVRNLEFPTFADAIQFVNRVAQDADEHDHHPGYRHPVPTVEGGADFA